ncbi:sigma-70 family RNA polymerase sigma factor [Candidatus Phytoplasma australiense]|uniref:DNA-Directed RNA Polymerase Sigma Subunit n=1 Tax=Strawberry lethal yellows phytoplasma (CPA) str. NZSb11 TaxID=980422 RepID=R4S095_PHYAS|nr:sigma-70 family RNA polymerase sigma factor [Candidatus Phytoplasma australiense]AGL90178.1 DNA-Directed RNA Polymerase Sigma Subunit [Strawberry lethal yellows phytoplasma (CPA) str. NZSb11]
METNEIRKQELFQEFLKNKNNTEIRNQLVELDYPLIQKIASSFKHYPQMLQREALFQEGVLSLIKVIDRYDPTGRNGGEFIEYATKNIKSDIRDLIQSCHPSSMPRKENKIKKVDFEEWEEATQPKWDKILNPHQQWLKQVHHDIFLQILTKNLTDKQFDVINWSLGVSPKDVEDNDKVIHSNQEIAEELEKKYNKNFSLRQVEQIKTQAIAKLQKIFKKGENN